jgi:phosphate transport system substrate-binding protein
VGSCTVYPFATVVAEQFGRSTAFKTPKIEATGSGGGLKLFCAGVGVEHPDITNASRRIKPSELDRCAANGVKEIVEVKIGYDGIVLASSRKAAPLKLTRKDISLALAKDVPAPDAVGIFGFSFLDQNRDKIQGSFVDGVQPEFDAIAEGQYPVSRPLYF